MCLNGTCVSLCAPTMQKHITRYKMWNGTYKQMIWPRWPYVTIAPFYMSGECTTKVPSGRYAWKVSWKLSPSPHGYGWIAHGSDIAHLGDVKPRTSSKVQDIVKCFCKSTTLNITKRCRLRKQGCPCMDYELVHWRSVFEFSGLVIRITDTWKVNPLYSSDRDSTGCGLPAGRGGCFAWQHHRESSHVAVYYADLYLMTPPLILLPDTVLLLADPALVLWLTQTIADSDISRFSSAAGAGSRMFTPQFLEWVRRIQPVC